MTAPSAGFDVVIVGAGMAGASSAFHLARGGAGRVLLVERETQAGIHSSGRSAAIGRQALADPVLAAMARDSLAFLRDPAPEEGWRGRTDLLGTEGALYLEGEGTGSLEAIAGTCEAAGIAVERWSPEQARRRQPLLRDARLAGALWSPGDGVVDAHALLTGLLESAEREGAEIRRGITVREIRAESGRVAGLATAEGTIDAGAVVVAAGAWAQGLARTAGASELPLRVTRRHLFVSAPRESLPEHIVWRVDDPIYFRREGGGLLLSPCDIADHAPGVPSVELEARELLLHKLREGLPALADLEIRSGWAGLRILTPDDRHIIGPDPTIEGLHWAAGLGGHGVTTAWETGRIAAAGVLEGHMEPAFDPSRFPSGAG